MLKKCKDAVDCCVYSPCAVFASSNTVVSVCFVLSQREFSAAFLFLSYFFFLSISRVKCDLLTSMLLLLCCGLWLVDLPDLE